jgi:hypothetical protein
MNFARKINLFQFKQYSLNITRQYSQIFNVFQIRRYNQNITRRYSHNIIGLTINNRSSANIFNRSSTNIFNRSSANIFNRSSTNILNRSCGFTYINKNNKILSIRTMCTQDDEPSDSHKSLIISFFLYIMAWLFIM